MLPNPFTTDPTQALMTTITREFEQILENGVLGTPVVVGNVTIVPVMITSFGIGAGGGSLTGEPVGGGGGGGVVPCALIIIGPDGVQVHEISSQTTVPASESIGRLAHNLALRAQGGRTAMMQDGSGAAVA
jgi:uncharacterized spore protein YtfJ